MMEESPVPAAAAVHRWITVYVATLLGMQSDRIDPTAPLATYDLDSVDAVEMAMQFECAFSRPIHPETFMVGDQSIDALAKRLADP